MTWEIHIGQVMQLTEQGSREIPRQVLIINDEVKSFIENFADTRKDEHLNTIYKINACEFTLHPCFKPAETDD